jgi:Tfp pilus assembly protein PilN
MEVTMGRIQLYIIGGILAFGLLTGIYYQWRKGIEREALLEYNQAQIEQNIKDQQAMREKLDAMAAKQKEIEDANANDKKVFKDKMDAINTDIISTNTVDRPSSDVLKKTVNKLKDVVK